MSGSSTTCFEKYSLIFSILYWEQLIAEFLENELNVRRVLFPGLDSHPQRALAKKQMTGPGTAVTFDIDGGIKSFFGGLKQQKTAVDNVNIKLMPNSVLGLVGESGSGKSTCGLMAMRLLDVTKGNIFLKGTEITNFSFKLLINLSNSFGK